MIPATSLNFNSIKVRLKRTYSPSVLPDEQQFQFHKGTIKTPELDSIGMQTQFQFHKGTIKTGHSDSRPPHWLISIP